MSSEAVKQAVDILKDALEGKRVSHDDIGGYAEDFARAFEAKAKEVFPGERYPYESVSDLTDKLGLNIVGLSALQAIITNAAKAGNNEAFLELSRLSVELGILYGTVTEREKHVATSGGTDGN